MPITLLPKKKKERGLAVSDLIYGNISLVVAVLVLVLVFALYGGLVFYESYLTKDTQSLEQEIEKLESERDKNLEEETLAFASKLEGIDYLLKRHTYPSLLFSFIEEIVHTEVYFNSFTFNAADRSITLSGAAPNYRILAEQIMVFKSNNKLSGVEISNISFSKRGEITFSVSFNVDESIFK